MCEIHSTTTKMEVVIMKNRFLSLKVALNFVFSFCYDT